MVANRCIFWDCKSDIRDDHILCRAHYDDFLDGLVNRCPGCGKLKYTDFNWCASCQNSRSGPVRRPQTDAAPKGRKVESSPFWSKGDSKAEAFYVYILKLDGGDFYVGQTRDLQVRVERHKDGEVPETKGKNPRLYWFQTLNSRERATTFEAELKLTKDRNEQRLREMMVRWQYAAKLVQFE